ncbi:class I adenylate-forming enzyme family protein [Allokutzneria oryzae]|uniref:Class I adenylate-forming enzyme family protein n=1 Tax=Allokutzneria oryzae TaxID=1378989 RepID=A0ABV6A3C1_9PSEU
MTASALHPLARVLEFTARGWWGPDTIGGLFERQVRARPGALAIVDSPDKVELTGIEPHRWSWARLDVEVDRIAALLQRHGVGPGEIVGVQLPNCVELVATFLAVLRLGGVVCPLPVQYREYELRALLPLAGARTFVTATRIGARAHAEIARQVCGEVVTVIAFGPNVPARVVSVAAAPNTAPVRSYTPDPNHCATICWTSGTESTPKAVPRAHYDWLAIARPCADAPTLTADDVILNPFPLVNMAGIAGTLLPWLLTGCRFVLHHPFRLPTFLRQVAEEHATYTVAPPAVLTLVLRKEGLELGSLRAIGSGSAPLAPSMVRGWQERHGIPIINFFGSNEGTALLSAPADFPDPEVRARFFPRYDAPGSTWSTRAAEWVRTRLVDPVTEREVTEPGHAGELRIAGPTVFPGYLLGTGDDPFDELGYLRTGDLFEIAGDRGQYLRYVDRAKDLIIRGGMNIAPAEVEALLVSHPGVADVAVVGYPDDVLGERACAFVVAAGQAPTAAELTEHLRARGIASYKLPERFEFVDALPRNPIGKLLKRELRERL